MAFCREDDWREAQKFERDWWMNNVHAHPGEIVKNKFVARMLFIDRGVPDRSVIDIGCGPVSLLLHLPVKSGVGVDPLDFGDLEKAYSEKNIRRLIKCGEDISESDGFYDEAWIYNCLQHVKSPVTILRNATKVAKIVRLFEWCMPAYHGHPWELTPEMLRTPFTEAGWYTRMETTGYLNHSGLVGKYFMGIFTRDKYNPDTEL